MSLIKQWMVAFHCGALWFYFFTFKRSFFGKDHISLFFSVLNIDVINLTDIIAVIIIYLLLLLI